MIKAVAINGNPVKQKGSTATVLTPFIQGMLDNGAEVGLFLQAILRSAINKNN